MLVTDIFLGAELGFTKNYFTNLFGGYLSVKKSWCFMWINNCLKCWACYFTPIVIPIALLNQVC
ncbi:hypothetical protein CEV31_4087 [Brucella thiophenivorans]|uniref:Uncharacterized protein n=1 Tax=Brucella thiophenivorans TaxID=571255 RepID=A0A256EYK8_9HYPH|nr:hypothetical protein CEV31_4087 [Brucella thiophenivorans]